MNSSKGLAPEDERFHVEVVTPLGLMRVVARGASVVGLYHGEHHPPPGPALLGHAVGSARRLPAPERGTEGEREAPAATTAVLADACRELGEYFRGSRRDFGVVTDLSGTPFQLSVWAALTEIPYGERRSYRDIAEHLGNPRMGRAVGAAVRANPVSIIVPGHRVVSSAGEVIGYAAGPEAKRSLLDLERVVSGAPGTGG